MTQVSFGFDPVDADELDRIADRIERHVLTPARELGFPHTALHAQREIDRLRAEAQQKRKP